VILIECFCQIADQQNRHFVRLSCFHCGGSGVCACVCVCLQWWSVTVCNYYVLHNAVIVKYLLNIPTGFLVTLQNLHVLCFEVHELTTNLHLC